MCKREKKEEQNCQIHAFNFDFNHTIVNLSTSTSTKSRQNKQGTKEKFTIQQNTAYVCQIENNLQSPPYLQGEESDFPGKKTKIK